MLRIILIVLVKNCVGFGERSAFNEINSDGSYSFSLSNNDIGGHYHTASGSPNKIVRGRYGSRNPTTRQIEETVYTAGPRGYRARGPQIYRKMDLDQYPRKTFGRPDDPLADPYDDPSYDFDYKTPEHERKEIADSLGRVQGLYSYLDDIGERHTVRYAAGSETGFEVKNSIPDTPISVSYNSPLYKTSTRARGKMSVQRGPNGQYKFIVSAPDQRRSESYDPDGIVRGSYSYLDDKGIQRTVQYIAGAGIGYRIIKSSTDSGAHVLIPPALPDLYDNQKNRNFLNDNDYLRQRNDNKKFGNSGGRRENLYKDETISSTNNILTNMKAIEQNNQNKLSNRFLKTNNINSKNNFNEKFKNRGSQKTILSDENFQNFKSNNRRKFSNSDIIKSEKNDFQMKNDYPFITNNDKQLEKERHIEWNRGRDSTIIKNVGKWYVSLPPGSAVRAHVQNIDLLPLGSHVPSPSEALLLDAKTKK